MNLLFLETYKPTILSYFFVIGYFLFFYLLPGIKLEIKFNIVPELYISDFHCITGESAAKTCNYFLSIFL